MPGRMRVNSGGGPERDDFGLPRVDIVVPDDARELDRDVQAYHRELRVLRRRQRLRRLSAPLTRHGLVMPLIASCLALTLLAGTLLTLFTAGQAAWVPAAPTAPPRTAPAAPGSQGQQRGRAGLPLLNATIVVNGMPTPLDSLPPAVLAVVPPDCRCAAALRQLASQTSAVSANLYLIGIGGADPTALTRQPGLRASQPGEDPDGVLTSYYHLTGLTAILVRPDHVVAAIIRAHSGRFPLGTALHQVVPGGQPA
jgi:hypothetical protein